MVAIHPETLKTLRKRCSLSQDSLATASTVGIATIKRIEASNAPRDVRLHTAQCLARALGVAVEALSGEPSSVKETRELGYRTLRETVDSTTALSYDMVEHIYGVSTRDQIAIAPLLVALMAEGSLVWRRKRLDDLNAAVDKVRSFGESSHSSGVIAHRAEELACWEKESIEKRDFFGHWTDSETEFGPDIGSAFVDYLRDVARNVECDNIFIADEISRDFPEYFVGIGIVDDLTAGDQWAWRAMYRGHVKVDDIPDDLLGEERDDDRIEWMTARIPEEERKVFEEENARWTSLLSEF